MARTFKFEKAGTYYNRFRSLPVVSSDEDGNQTVSAGCIDCLTTRWGYQKSRYRRPTDAYYCPQNGMWYRINSRVCVGFAEDGTPRDWVHAFEPIKNEVLNDRYLVHTVTKGDAFVYDVTVKDGKAVHVNGYPEARAYDIVSKDGAATKGATNGSACLTAWTPEYGEEMLRELLALNQTKRRSPRKAA